MAERNFRRFFFHEPLVELYAGEKEAKSPNLDLTELYFICSRAKLMLLSFYTLLLIVKINHV